MAALFLAGLLAYGIGVYGFTQYLGPIQAEFGWNRAVLGGMMSAFWLAAPFVLVASYTLDFAGLRVLVLIGAAIEAIGLVWLTLLSHPFEFFAVRFLMGAGKCLVVTPLPIAVARWFRRRTGFGFAIALCGWHVGGLIMAPLAAFLATSGGWRLSARVLAAILVLGMGVAAIWMKPPRSASAPGGEPSAPAASDARPAPLQLASPLTLAAIGFGTIAFYIGYAALLSQLSPLLADAGLDAGRIGAATGAVAVCAVFGVLACGALTQALPPRWAGAALLLLMAVLELGARSIGAGAALLALAGFVLLLGLLIGGGDPILIEALRLAVPLRRFGRAYGWWYLLCLGSLAITPVIAGAAFDRDANYQFAFGIMGALSLAASLLWIVAVRPVPSGD